MGLSGRTRLPIQFPSSKGTGEVENVEKSPLSTGHFGNSSAQEIPKTVKNNTTAVQIDLKLAWLQSLITRLISSLLSSTASSVSRPVRYPLRQR